MRLRPESAVVTISYVQESPTRQGLRRFLIGAEREGVTLAERYLSFTTLDPLKASRCDRARIGGEKLFVRYRDTGYFDYDLLFVDNPEARVSA